MNWEYLSSILVAVRHVLAFCAADPRRAESDERRCRDAEFYPIRKKNRQHPQFRLKDRLFLNTFGSLTPPLYM